MRPLTTSQKKKKDLCADVDAPRGFTEGLTIRFALYSTTSGSRPLVVGGC